MRDGVKLYTVVYSPKDASQKYPILMTRTPYSAGPYGADVNRRSLGPSAAFMRELARRMAQFAILRGDETITEADMRLAFEEMVSSGSFTKKALGADAIDAAWDMPASA